MTDRGRRTPATPTTEEAAATAASLEATAAWRREVSDRTAAHIIPVDVAVRAAAEKAAGLPAGFRAVATAAANGDIELRLFRADANGCEQCYAIALSPRGSYATFGSLCHAVWLALKARALQVERLKALGWRDE